jgi:hypothetical protein
VTDQPTSGSRWEPTPPDRAARPAAGPAGAVGHADHAGGPRPAATPSSPSGADRPWAPDPWTAVHPEVRSSDVRRPGRRAWFAGVAAVLFLGGSAGGYAVGHQSADDVPAPGVGSQDAQRPGFGGQDPDGDAHDTGIRTEEGGIA